MVQRYYFNLFLNWHCWQDRTSIKSSMRSALINFNNSLNRESKKWQNKSLGKLSSIRILNKNSLKIMNWIASNLNFKVQTRETRNRLLGADIATDKKKPFNTNVPPRKVFRSNHRRKVEPSDPSLIKPSGQIQLVRPKKPKRSKASINPVISLNHEPKGWKDMTKCTVVHWNPQ
jgi:hypothetical protein